MIKLIFRQIFFIVTTFIGVTIVSFYLHTLSPINTDGANQNTNSEQVAPNHLQRYLGYLNKVFQGDLGISSSTRKPVSTEFISHLPASIELVFLASLIAIFVGLPLGVISAIKHRKLTDMALTQIGENIFSGTNTFPFEIEFSRINQKVVGIEISNFGAKKVVFNKVSGQNNNYQTNQKFSAYIEENPAG